MRRGLTLIETLLSVALLSALVIAAGSWLRLAGHAASELALEAKWRSAAAAALQLIADDLESGNPGESDRVECESDLLAIRTRDGGPVQSEYALGRGTLTRRLIPMREATGSGATPARLLVGDATEFEAVIEEAEFEDILRVRIASTHGDIAERRFVLR